MTSRQKKFNKIVQQPIFCLHALTGPAGLILIGILAQEAVSAFREAPCDQQLVRVGSTPTHNVG